MRNIAVYVDVLIVVNFIIGYLMLKMVAYLIPKRTTLLRLYLGSAVSALGSLVILLPQISESRMHLYRFLIGGIAIITAFGFNNWRKSALQILLYYGVGICFSGAMLVCYRLFPSQKLFIYNGVFYFDIPPIVLVGSLAVGYGLTKGLILIASIRSPQEHRCIVTIVTKGGMVALDGLIDTGNKLTEPFSGFPVIVVKRSAVAGILPAFFNHQSTVPLGEGIRIIPYYSVGGTGIMYGFRPERLEIKTSNQLIVTENVYIAVDDSLKENDECNAIVSILCFKEGDMCYGLEL